MTSRSIGPRTWLLIGDKPGDNSQVRSIVDALPWPYEVRSVVPLERFRYRKPTFRPSLAHIDRERSDAIEPPWPDLVVTVGRRPAMVALWIRKQSGNRTKIVLLGRPRRWLRRFALVISPSQDRLPPRDNVLRLELPLMRVDPRRLEEEAARWRPRLAGLPRPLIGVLVGGATAPFVFDAEVANDLVRRATALLGGGGGTLYVTTSRRTSPEVVEALEAALPASARLHRWGGGGAGADAGDNPYLGLLALADGFIVTGDSVSMLVEVARLEKPLVVYELPVRGGMIEKLRRGLGRSLHGDQAPLRPLGEILYRMGILKYSRDLTVVHRRLFASGSAVPLGQPFPRTVPPFVDELGKVVERIKGLFDS